MIRAKKMIALAPEKKSDRAKVSHNQIERSLNEGLMCYALVARQAEPEIEAQISEHNKLILAEFSNFSRKICQVSCLQYETFNMPLT